MKKGSIILLLTVAMVAGCGEKKTEKNVVGVLPGTVDGVDLVKSLPVAEEKPSTDTMNYMTWRGPNRNGHAVDQSPLTQWDESNVLWKVEVPGKGHSSPIIVGDKIFLTTSDKYADTQSVHCFDRTNGQELWSKLVHEGGLTKRIHNNNSHASHTAVSDGSHFFAMFVNDQNVMMTCFTLDGEQVWQKKIGQFNSDWGFGAGSSPIIWDSKIIISSESGIDPFVVALNPENGEDIWRITRSKLTSYATPVVANVADKNQLLLAGLESVTSYNPQSGEKLWSVPAKWQVNCGTMVWDKDVVFSSGGFPEPQTIAIAADGSGEVLWEKAVKCYEQSMIVVDGYIYALADNGICYCWEAATGKEMWKERMQSGVSASPVYAGGHLYFPVERGTCFVIKPNPEKYELVAENQLGESTFATPTFVDNKIYARVAFGKHSARQEWLYCIGEK